MAPHSLRVHLAERSYDIVVTHDDFAGIGPFARQCGKGTQAFFITDRNAAVHAKAIGLALGAAGFRGPVEVRPAGEAQKSLDVARQLYDGLLNSAADRRTLVVAVGGGVIGDLAGFVAST